MVPKIKKPDKPKPLVNPDEMKPVTADETSRAYSSLISTSPSGLLKPAKTVKKSLLGG